VNIAEQLERSVRSTVFLSPAAIPRHLLRPGALLPIAAGDVYFLPGRAPAPWEAVRELLEEPEA